MTPASETDARSVRAREDATVPTRHAWLPRGRAGLAYRAGVAVRAVAAIVGGYALSALAAVAIALYVPGSSVEASITAALAAFVVYPCAVIWVFAARTAWRACLGLVVVSLVPGALVFGHYMLGGAA